jgi:hypothetical protein
MESIGKDKTIGGSAVIESWSRSVISRCCRRWNMCWWLREDDLAFAVLDAVATL